MSEILLAVQGVIVTVAFTFVAVAWRFCRSTKSSQSPLTHEVS